jgi:peptidoglycan/xylan/chitin deacetylase (PgdA/CDA1 family)
MGLLKRSVAHVTQRIQIKRFHSKLTRSIASVTFDDFPKSSWRVGGPILARHHASATFYVAGSLCNRSFNGLEFYTAEDLSAVHAAGHEIGNHTYLHHNVRLVSSESLLTDLVKNSNFVQQTVGDVIPETFAYPFGETSIRTKIVCARNFACCRGTNPGVNFGSLDLGQLKVASLESRQWKMDEIEELIATASHKPCWIIFLTHDIDDSPTPYGSTPSMLEDTLAKTRAAGIDILTVKNALARACFGTDFPAVRRTVQ